MKEDYLWDKTGEPDQQIQELEEILGTLRYQPKPLVIPADLVVTKRPRNFRPLLAIAASLLLALLAGALWLSLKKPSTPQPVVVKRETTQPANPVEEKVIPKNVEQPEPKLVARNKPRRTPKVRTPEPEAEAAKEQLMLALRLASEKLNVVSRKTQTPTQIRNQHKIG